MYSVYETGAYSVVLLYSVYFTDVYSCKAMYSVHTGIYFVF